MCRLPAWRLRHLTRGFVLGALVVVGTLAAAIGAAHQGPAAQASPSAAAIQAEKIRDNLYVLRGGGRIFQIGGISVPQAGTTAAFITANGVVLVDTKLPGWGKPIID